MKKNAIKILIILIIVLVILGILYNFTIINNSKIQVVQIGQEFTLKKGQTAKIKDKEVYLNVKDFIYSPPPAGTQSIWSGLDVIYQLTVDGEIYENAYYSDYDVTIVESNYKTYSKFIISNKQ